MLADCADALKDSMRLIEKLDYIFSKGKLKIIVERAADEYYISIGHKTTK